MKLKTLVNQTPVVWVEQSLPDATENQLARIRGLGVSVVQRGQAWCLSHGQRSILVVDLKMIEDRDLHYLVQGPRTSLGGFGKSRAAW